MHRGSDIDWFRYAQGDSLNSWKYCIQVTRKKSDYNDRHCYKKGIAPESIRIGWIEIRYEGEEVIEESQDIKEDGKEEKIEHCCQPERPDPGEGITYRGQPDPFQESADNERKRKEQENNKKDIMGMDSIGNE